MLDELFRCDQFQHLFPGESMPVRACLRRQLERIPTKDAKGRLVPLAEWRAPKPYCAAECPVGRAHLERARAEHVPAETCLRCGGAQVGDGSAAPCASCPPDEKQVPRGSLRSGAPQSGRLWTGEVPDVPIGAPGPARPKPVATFEEHERQASARRVELEDDDQDVPAAPAEEQTMAKASKTEKAICGVEGGGTPLRSDNKSGVCAKCNRGRKAPGAAPAGRVKPLVAKVTALRPATPRRAKAADQGLQEAPLAELLRQRALAADLVAAVDAELLRRKREIDEVLSQPRRASAEG